MIKIFKKSNKIFKCQDKEITNNMRDPEEEFMELPICYGNYCQKHVSCHNCSASHECKRIPLPKEPEWCNPD